LIEPYPTSWRGLPANGFPQSFLARPEISPRADGRPTCPTKQDVGRLQALLGKAKGKEGIKVVRKKLAKAIKALVSERPVAHFFAGHGTALTLRG